MFEVKPKFEVKSKFEVKPKGVIMDANTPNIHTPPEEHAPPVSPERSHEHEDIEQAFLDHDHVHPHSVHPHHEEPPLVILDRRFAKGEITKEVYAESKGLLLKK